MKAKTITFIMILLAVFLLCSCNMDPELSGDAEKVADVGIQSVTDVVNKYNESGSYSGLTIVAGDNYVLTYNFANCSTTVDLSQYGLGTKTVVINGQVATRYEAYPEAFPATATYNISFRYDGVTHTMEVKLRMTGVSSGTATNIKIDGKKYKDESM